jgi:hypothetical protein
MLRAFRSDRSEWQSCGAVAAQATADRQPKAAATIASADFVFIDVERKSERTLAAQRRVYRRVSSRPILALPLSFHAIIDADQSQIVSPGEIISVS